MAQPYPVVGIEGTGTQLRLEIRDLQKKPIQFSLFIRALNRVHEMRSTDEQSSDYLNKPNSWWQIGKHIQTDVTTHNSTFESGAIHGLPYEPWR